MGLKKKVITIVLLVVMSISPVFANMPVIDVTAITQAITGYVQTIMEWQATLQQWRSEYDRIKQAAEGIASGRLTDVLMGVASMANQVADWRVGNSEWLDNSLRAVGDGSYSVLGLLNDADYMVSAIDIFQKNMSKLEAERNENWNKGVDANNKGDVEGAIDGFGSAGGNLFDSVDAFGDGIISILQGLNSGLENVQGIANSVSQFFHASPGDLANIYDEHIAKVLGNATGDSSIKTARDFNKWIDSNLKKQLGEDQKSLMQVNRSKNETKYNQLAVAVEMDKQKIEEAYQLLDWAMQMEDGAQKYKDEKQAFDQAISEREEKKRQRKIEEQAEHIRTQQYLNGKIDAGMRWDAILRNNVDYDSPGFMQNKGGHNTNDNVIKDNRR